MAQIIAARTIDGVVLAAENWALQLDEEGRETAFQVNRLLPLTSHCALLTAGAAEGIGMGSALEQFARGEGFEDIDEVYGAALPFLSTEYERFMRKKCEVLPVDPIHQVSFVLAGRTEKDPAMPYRLYFLWTKKKLPHLDGDEISFAFSLPRRMGLEFELNRACKEKVPLKEILERVRQEMDTLRKQGEVRPPIVYATITPEGYQSINP